MSVKSLIINPGSTSTKIGVFEDETLLFEETLRHSTEEIVAVFVVNTLGKGILSEMAPEEHIYEICNVQSISAAIQNMLLAAEEKGIGSLWICDIYFAYAEISEWLNSEGQLIAAVAFGYPNEFPKARPRKAFDEVVVWRG